MVANCLHAEEAATNFSCQSVNCQKSGLPIGFRATLQTPLKQA